MASLVTPSGVSVSAGRPARDRDRDRTVTPSGGGADAAAAAMAARWSATLPVVTPDSARKALITATPGWVTAAPPACPHPPVNPCSAPFHPRPASRPGPRSVVLVGTTAPR